MLDRKMAIFGYQHVQYPISRQHHFIKTKSKRGTLFNFFLTHILSNEKFLKFQIWKIKKNTLILKFVSILDLLNSGFLKEKKSFFFFLI